MLKTIVSYQNRHLSELNIQPGDLVAFENKDLDVDYRFLLGIANSRLALGHYTDGIRLSFHLNDERVAQHTFYPCGEVLGLLMPYQFGKGKILKPNFNFIKPSFVYRVDVGYSGKDAIVKGLIDTQPRMDLYAEYLETKKLITERGIVGDLAEKLGLGKFLPNQVRFVRKNLGILDRFL